MKTVNIKTVMARIVQTLAVQTLAVRMLAVMTVVVTFGATGCADRIQTEPRGHQDSDTRPPWTRVISEESDGLLERKLGFTTRNAFDVFADEGWRQTVSVPSGASLDVSLGLPCPSEGACSGLVRWQLEALQDKAPPKVLLKTSVPRARLQTWQTTRINLGHLSGETVDLALTVDFEAPPSESLEQKPPFWWAEPLWVQPRDQPFHNVILISIDTLRQDRLGCYGYHRDTSPSLDRFAAEGVLFHQAISQAPWTTPAHGSLLTSLYPSAHRVNQGLAVFANHRAQYRGLPRGVPTLAGILRENGYRTVALTGGVTVSADLFFSGFDVYQEGFYFLTDWNWSRLLPVLDDIESVPFFLFFHTFEVHTPYNRLGMVDDLLTESEIEGLRTHMASDDLTWRSQKKYLEDNGLFRKDVSSVLYDSGVRHTDDFMGRLFQELERRGLLDRTLIVITSDHGEELGENHPQLFYGEHGHNVSEELIRVPLILRMPGELQPGLEVDDPVELVDVAPTILELLRLPVPAGLQGQSLVPGMRAPGSQGAAWTLSESTKERLEMKSLRGRQYKYIVAFEPVGEERGGLSGAVVSENLYDLQQDPGESQSLHEEELELLRSMRKRLVDTFATMAVPAAAGEMTAVSEERLEQLRAMGYIE